MKNKVLVKIYVPSIDSEYEIYIPVNETIKKVLDLLIKSIYELSDSNFNNEANHYIMDPKSGLVYEIDYIIRDTNIRNGSKIILI